MEHVIGKIGNKNSPLIVELKEFEGKKLFDIRKYFIDKKTEELLPTRKGVSLNSFQLQQLIETINSQSESINEYFFQDEEKSIEIKTDLKISNLLGRSFKFQFENGNSSIFLDKQHFGKLKENELTIIKTALLLFNSVLFDILEDQAEVELALDLLDHKLKRTQW